MANIDERIVELAFKGSQFISGISQSIGMLTRLKESLSSMKGAENDLNGLDNAGRRFSLSGMIGAVDQAAHHFSLLRIAGLTAFTSLVRQGLFAGENILKSLTIDPIKAGLDVYETKINAIQTILANTASEGTNLKQVTAALNQLNTYANKTVYNFGQMAKNIGTFTAAGVGLNTAVTSIKGIANLAALSGASAEQASGAMYQLSQAIAAGRVKLQDWNSVVNAGLGGKVFQNAILQTARVNGVAVDAMLKKYGGFRNALQSGFVTSKILTQALSLFTGDLTDKQLRAMGFTAQETKAIQAQAAQAVKSATQIRTITQLFSALREEIATAFSHVFEALIGNIGQASKTLSSLHTTLENAFTGPINNLAKMLAEFRKLGGIAVIGHTIGLVFHDLGAILGTVGAAFHAVFPPGGGSAAQGLLKMVVAVHNFVAALTPSKTTLEELKTIFTGVFSIIKIVIDVIGALISAITHVGSSAGSAGGGFLAFLATIASFITKAKDALESGHLLATVFTFLANVLVLPAHALGAILGYLGGLSGAADQGTSAISGFVQKVGSLFHGLADAIASGISSGNFQKVGALLNTVLIGGILLKIRSFISQFGKAGSGGGIFATIKESIEGLTTTLSAMQARLKAGILEKIAIAIGILAAAILVLSLVNVGNLVKSLSAITVLFTELSVAILVLSKTGGGIARIAAVGVALDLLAAAILILAGAVAILAQFSLDQLARGLGTIIGLLAALVATTQLLSKNTPGLIATAFALNLLAVALNILAAAVAILGRMDLGTLAKGIGSIAVLLAILAGFNAISGTQLISTAAAMAVIGVAINIIARAVEELGKLSPVTLAKGLLSVALALGIMALAMDAIPPTTIASATAILLVATAMVVLGQALQTFGGLSPAEIAKSLIVLAGALTLIVAAMIFSTEGLPGAAAILVMAGALAILTPVLVALGQLSWESIAKGLVTLVGVFVILAAAGIALTPVVPTLLALGGAIALLGVGILAAGAGVALFAVGLTALGLAVTTAGAAIVGFVKDIIGLIPFTLKSIGEGIVAFATAIGSGGAAIFKAFQSIFGAVLDAITTLAPKAGRAFDAVMTAIIGAINRNKGRASDTFFNLLITLLNKVTQFAPRLTTAAANAIIAMINGINRQVGRMANAATNLIVNFINTIGNDTGRVIAAGVNMVIKVINGIANQIRASSGAMNAAGRNLGSAIIQGMISGIAGLAGGVFGAIENLASGAISAARNILRSFSPSREFVDIGESIPQGMQVGVKNRTGDAVNQVGVMGKAMLTGIAQSMQALNDTIDSNLNLQPTITPVIDLTQAKAGLSGLNDITKAQLIAATASASHAASITTDNLNAAALAGLAIGNTTTLNFEQNNTSPVALDEVTVYRRTRNQLSIAKGVLSATNSGVGK